MNSSVTVEDLRCNNCGASLHVPPNVRFVTCPYCGSSLEIHRSTDGVYTEVLQKISQKTERMAEELELVRLNQQLDALNDEWERERQSYGKHSRTSEPGNGDLLGAMVGMGVAAVIALMGLTGAFGEGSAVFLLAGIVGFAMMLFMYFQISQKLEEYSEARDRYQTQRDQLKNRIQRLEHEAREQSAQ